MKRFGTLSIVASVVTSHLMNLRSVLSAVRAAFARLVGSDPRGNRSAVTLSGLLVCAFLCTAVAGCGGSTHSSPPPQSPSSPAPQPIAVTVAGAPMSLPTGGTVGLTATVTNDSSNGGVTWSCTPANSCGSFNPTSTASGSATTYTAPATAPSGGSVTVTATSVTDSTKAASATISITASSGGGGTTGSASLQSGTFVFLLTGLDAQKHFFGLAGEVQLDGNGNVTAGEQDFSDANGLNSNGATPDTISSGTYKIGSDGRGTMTLPTNDMKLGVSGVETLSITVVNSKHALITELDSSATGSGTLDFQTLGTNGLSQSTGGWSFVDVGQNNHASYSQGGVFTLNASSQNAICPQSTTPCYPLSQIVTDFDEIDMGTRQVTLGDGNGTGYFLPPDQFGRGAAFYGGIYWDYYVVGPEVMRLLGYFPQTGTFSQVYVGSAYSQGTGTFSASSFNGSFVFGDAGTAQSTTFGAGGLIKFDGTSNISGFADVSEGSAAPTSAAFSGTYQMNIPVSFNNAAATAVNGYGRMTITPGATQDVSVMGMYAVDPNLNVNDPNDATTQHGPAALLADLDQNVNGSGTLFGQETASGAAQGNFALNSQIVTASNGEADLVGQAAANSNQFTGNVDVNDFAFNTGVNSAVPFSLTLTPDTTNVGRFTTSLMLKLGGTEQTVNAVFYQVSDAQFVIVDAGTSISGTGTVQKQQ